MLEYSAVIRCKNEEKWLSSTLSSLQTQSRLPTKIILVDNNSQDRSQEIAISNGAEIVNYPLDKKFNYSYSLNLGIRECQTPLILLISAHCILTDMTSVERLIEIFDLFEPAGAFGRQLPTVNSNAIDTRDLLTVFGRERIIYEKHPFFHNAFSMIRYDLWQTHNFDETIDGIEDRLWAQKMCDMGHKIVYEPRASVYHEHGLNQGSNESRASRVCKALYQLHKDESFEYPSNLLP